MSFVIGKPELISPLGAIPKTAGGVRLIHDCSRPAGNSLNDFAVAWNYSSLSIVTIMYFLPGLGVWEMYFMCGFYICVEFTRSRYNKIHDDLLSPLLRLLVVFLE